MNGAIERYFERRKGGFVAFVRFPHQSKARPMTWPDGAEKLYQTAAQADSDIYSKALSLLSGGGNKIRGAINGVENKHTAESVFGKGA